MKTWTSKLDMDDLAERVYDSVPFRKDSTGIEMSNVQGELPEEGWVSAVADAIAEIEALTWQSARAIMVNRLRPGIEVPVHTDEEAEVERFHLPVLTNNKALCWTASGGEFTMSRGVWYGPFPFTEPHYVSNLGDTPRIHIVVDVTRR